ncbi:MAG: hypothetical protein U0441_14175 [Polyangiaceae bacterium]
MISQSAKKWIEAGKILAQDPTSEVRCPERDDGVLRVQDVPIAGEPKRMERYLVCDTCGARNILLMRVPHSG